MVVNKNILKAKSKNMRNDTFKDFVLEQLDGLEEVKYRAMFGGFGLYLKNKFFGIIQDGTLFVKTNQQTKQDFLNHKMKPFTHSEKQTLINYYEIPADVLEDKNTLKVWVSKACSF